MLSDLVSTYAAAGNRVPPSSPDSDIHFLPLPVRGLMAVLRLWESWLGEHTFTDKALVEVRRGGAATRNVLIIPEPPVASYTQTHTQIYLYIYIIQINCREATRVAIRWRY